MKFRMNITPVEPPQHCTS